MCPKCGEGCSEKKIITFFLQWINETIKENVHSVYETMSSFTCWILQPSLQHESPGLLGLTNAASSSRPPKHSLEKTIFTIVLHTYRRSPSFSVRWVRWCHCFLVTLMKKQIKWKAVQNSSTFSTWAIAFPKQGLRRLGILKFTGNKYRNM